MKVTLIQKPQNPLDVIYTAARTCYSAKQIHEIWKDAKNTNQEKKEQLVRSVLESGHLSILEHVSYTFAVDDIIRIITQQLVRHRVAAYSQQSQRYVKMGDLLDAIEKNAPPIIRHSKSAMEAYMVAAKQALDNYNHIFEQLISEGYSQEQAAENARNALPNCCPSNIMFTMNLREFIHVCGVRRCSRAQDTIQELFDWVFEIINDDFPFIGPWLEPQCRRLGYCPETRNSCGLMPLKKEVIR